MENTTPIKTSNLEGKALDYAVALCEGLDAFKLVNLTKRLPGIDPAFYIPHYSTDWAQGGPIIERERIEFSILASKDEHILAIGSNRDKGCLVAEEGITYLIAAMRCYVASKMGESVNIPNELINK
jgi:hypothetical protein